MRYRLEFMPNEDCICIHLDCRLSTSYLSSSELRYDNKYSEQDGILLSLLSETRGVENGICHGVTVNGYTVTAYVGGVFTRAEVAANLVETIKTWLQLNGQDVSEAQQLPTLRTDIRYKRCPACIAEEERAVKETRRLLETLDRDSQE